MAAAKRFTFMEVTVYAVLLTVTLLLALYYVRQIESPEQRQVRQARDDIIWFTSAMGAYTLDTGKPIPTLAEGGLLVLVDAGYLPYIPTDPYGNLYHYQTPALNSGQPFEVMSYGADGKESLDDIVSWDLYGRRLLLSQAAN